MKNFQPLFLICLMVSLAGCNQNSNQGHLEDYFPLPESAGELITSEAQNFHLQTVLEGLAVPWGMTFLPDGIMLITERQGSIRMVKDGKLHDEPVKGAPEVRVGGTGGLLDIRQHPDYEENGWIYITYSASNEGLSHTALMRARLSGHSLVDQEVLFSGHPFTESGSHFGSRIAFKDGYVFFSTGDRGQMESSQDLSIHNGSILRLHDNGEIPSDNPFVGQPNIQPEIYSYGHRNPQGLNFHPDTGKLWTHEHGPQGSDEINIIKKGENYGWPEITHGIADDGSIITEDTIKAGMQPPLHYWSPSIGPSAMVFVTGDVYPGWKGNLLISSLVGSRISRIIQDGEKINHEEPLLQGQGRFRNIVIGPDGFLYIANESTGEILRVIPEGMIQGS